MIKTLVLKGEVTFGTQNFLCTLKVIRGPNWMKIGPSGQIYDKRDTLLGRKVPFWNRCRQVAILFKLWKSLQSTSIDGSIKHGIEKNFIILDNNKIKRTHEIPLYLMGTRNVKFSTIPTRKNILMALLHQYAVHW